MSQPGKNLRLRRTQKLLREALVDLIDEVGFDQGQQRVGEGCESQQQRNDESEGQSHGRVQVGVRRATRGVLQRSVARRPSIGAGAGPYHW